jgi:hypothetical protein
MTPDWLMRMNRSGRCRFCGLSLELGEVDGVEAAYLSHEDPVCNGFQESMRVLHGGTPTYIPPGTSREEEARLVAKDVYARANARRN